MPQVIIEIFVGAAILIIVVVVVGTTTTTESTAVGFVAGTTTLAPGCRRRRLSSRNAFVKWYITVIGGRRVYPVLPTGGLQYVIRASMVFGFADRSPEFSRPIRSGRSGGGRR